jgi:hypothetical protein
MTLLVKPLRLGFVAALALGSICLAAPRATAQGGRLAPKVEIAWNRYYDYAELLDIMHRLQAAYPEFVRTEDIGRTYEGRAMRVLVLTNQATGKDREKVGMWVDGNVHGNEVQGAEAALYLAWWLLEKYDTNERARALLDRRVFYILPSQNPDGRDHWFHEPNTQHSSRSSKKPRDDDRDGLFDEDGYDDMNGDGEITSMRKGVPMGTGTHRVNRDDPRIMERVSGDQQGDYVMLGAEGIDNDGDGRVNEDGPGYYDMNRNWPSDWQPPHIQGGAGEYPLSNPETRAIAMYLLDHPNVAAVQSFHNTGGMILRGPGSQSVSYPAADVRVYDEIGRAGEKLLPFYRYLIIWKDLYSTHGAFTWAYEGLGVFTFSNELWSGKQYYNSQEGPSGAQRDDYVDHVLLDDVRVPWEPAHHPLYGDIEVGGHKREHGRVAPSFMIEEMSHRNAMFCVLHAEEIADVTAEPLRIEPVGDGVWRVRAAFRNTGAMPTRSALSGDKGVGVPDRVTISGAGIEVVAGGRVSDRWRDERIDLTDDRPNPIRLEYGVPSRGRVEVAWIVAGSGDVLVRYAADKADDVRATGTLR